MGRDGRNADTDDRADELLADRMLGGDDEAAASLVRRHHARLFGTLFVFTRNRADAEEIFQETFARVLAARDRYDRSRPFKPWLYTIALNLARDRASRKGHRATPRTTDDGALPEPARAAPRDAEETALHAATDVQRALAKLSDAHREVVWLRYFEGFDEAEIASAVAVPRGTVKSRLHHALKKLREILTP